MTIITTNVATDIRQPSYAIAKLPFKCHDAFDIAVAVGADSVGETSTFEEVVAAFLDVGEDSSTIAERGDEVDKPKVFTAIPFLIFEHVITFAVGFMHLIR